MVRPLPSPLLAALASSTQQPFFTVTAQDLVQTRQTVLAQGLPPGRSAALVTAAGTLLRAALTQGADPNPITVQRITDPTSAAQWRTAGTAIATGASRSAGVALAQTGGTIRCFYRRAADGLICYRDSPDDGVNWSAESSIPGVPLGGTAALCWGLAATGTGSVLQACSVYASPGSAAVLARSTQSGGAWSTWSNEGPSAPTWYGISGLQAIAAGATDVIAAGAQLPNPYNGISAALCTHGSGYTAWGVVQQLDNPSLGLSTAWPSVHTGPGGYYVTTQLTDDGSVSTTPGTRTRVLFTADLQTYTPVCEMGGVFQWETHAMQLGGRLYAFDAGTTVLLSPPPAPADASADALHWSISAALNREAHLVLALSNEQGQWNNHPSIRSDATISLAMGYGTSAVTVGTFLIDSYTYSSAAGHRQLLLQCRDRLKLLDYPSPRMESLGNRTIGQLIGWLCGQAGIAAGPLPATAQFGSAVPCFTVNQGETWLHALQRVSAIYGFRYWCDETGTPRVVEPSAADTSSWTYGQEAVSVGQTWGADQANVIRVVGVDADGNAVFAQAMDGTAYLTAGRERYRHVVERQLDTAAKCALRAGIELRDEQMAAWGADMVVAPNPAHELADVVSFADPDSGTTAARGRIVHQTVTCTPESGIYEQTLGLSGV